MKSFLLFLLMVGVVAVQTAITLHNAAVAGSTLRYLEAGPPGPTTVLLLHGARFTSETWRELGTIATLADAGHHVIAFDLPGYGNSERSRVPRNEYLNQTLGQLWPASRFIIVSPSMSLGFSLPFVARRPDRVAGYVPVAPVGIDDHRAALERVNVPTLVVWGENESLGHSGVAGQRAGRGAQRRHIDSRRCQSSVLSGPTRRVPPRVVGLRRWALTPI